MQHQITHAVAIAVERWDDQRVAHVAEQQRVGRVDQLRVVLDIGVALGRRVHLLLEHPFIDRADGVLGAAKDLRAQLRGMAKGVLGHGAAVPPGDLLGAVGDLVEPFALAPFLRAIGIAHRHTNHRDRRMDTADRPDARDAAAGAHDHRAIDPLAQDRVWAADIAPRLGCDRRGLEPKADRSHRVGGIVDYLVVSRAAVLQAQIEALERQVNAGNTWVEHAQGLLQQLLAGLVAFEHDDGVRHR